MRIDSHQHFWDRAAVDYFWMPPDHPVLSRNYLPEDLWPIYERNLFDGSVVVQAAHNDAEGDWLLAMAAREPKILGVVAWADLESPELGRRLDVLQTHPKFKGIRHIVHDEPEVDWLLRPRVLEGLRELARRGIPYDLLLKPPHLPVAIEVMERVPELRCVVDHIAKPYIAKGEIEPWLSGMRTLSQVPTMHVKLSGMITEAQVPGWQPTDLAPYVQQVLELFGTQRCMFGSDWPVCLLAGSWKEVLAAFTQACGPMAMDRRAELLGDTAERFYNL
ncbi:MAG: amidohydrolase family protein [Bryobacteraceae bacterium]|nr:amidohydrolase family protein [Bryobacteraceae bacterium]